MFWCPDIGKFSGEDWRFVVSTEAAHVISWSEILGEETIEVLQISFEEEKVMIRSSKDDLIQFESWRVG